MKRKDPFKPKTPQTGQYFIDQIKCPIIKKKLQANWDECVRRECTFPKDHLYKSMLDFIDLGIFHAYSKEGIEFWGTIEEHFYSGVGLKNYSDFKHLDRKLKKFP